MSCGSSPRVRGTHRTSLRSPAYPRFIPTGAGNTPEMRILSSVGSVHPHGCGEHNFCPACCSRPDGSSPRVRGTREKYGVVNICVRFIPTGAGNTLCSRSRLQSVAVHPHGCGEHITADGYIPVLPGSSPRVRGTHTNPEADAAADRFIPTGAGNTDDVKMKARYLPVHPHGCGEHSCSSANIFPRNGSSPRVRGTHRISDL